MTCYYAYEPSSWDRQSQRYICEWKCFYMVEQRFDDVWGLRLGLVSQSKLENKWLWVSPYMVVYRSWTFGFDSGIPHMTISGRSCDWTGSRGLHLLVSEPGYAITGTVTCSLVTMLVWDGFGHPLLILPLKMWFWLNDLNKSDPCSF
ncbi:hypothetical protein GQ457_16G019890 [Hibiscus cannabinus]